MMVKEFEKFKAEKNKPDFEFKGENHFYNALKTYEPILKPRKKGLKFVSLKMINDGKIESTGGTISKKRKETTTKRKAQFRYRMRTNLINESNLPSKNMEVENPGVILNNIMNKNKK
jgi:hypothetical protein